MKFSISNPLLFILIISFTGLGCAKDINKQKLTFDLNNKTTLNYIINQQIKEQYSFSGMALYLNQVHYSIVDTDNIRDLDRNFIQAITLGNNQWLAISGRFKVLLIQAPDAVIKFNQTEIISIQTNNTVSNIHIIEKPQLKNFALELDQLRYNHLWKPFAVIAKLSESLMVLIHSLTGLSWGLVILIFAVIIKLLLLPVSIITTKSQQKVSQISSLLQPQLKAIKSKYDGEIAHNKIIQAHKNLGVSPFYTLKPMLSFLIQIPVLIAIFNALGEMPQLSGQPFLWFDDLSQPDMLFSINVNIPLLGSYLNLMPFVMTFITLISTIFHRDNHASKNENKKQKLKLYLMAAGFLILFYPFPAAMVMYWAMANLLGFIQQKML